MHDTAYEHGRLFFELYGSEAFHTVVELGSQDVNGSLRDHCPPGTHYIGMDVMVAKGVDLVVNPAGPLPIASETIDAVVTSSAFEHDVCFWETFLELIRILRPGGLLYVNAPSNGGFHRYPLDCWRFYPDAGSALVQWAARRGVQVELVESFIGLPQAEHWADFVAVFRKAGGPPLIRTGRIAKHASAINIHDQGMQPGAPLEAETGNMPDMTIAEDLRIELAACPGEAAVNEAVAAGAKINAALAGDIAAAQAETATLCRDLNQAEQRIDELETALADARREVVALRTSISWRITAGPRRLMAAMRGR
jgi:SAM-dependent methyltransferase